MKRILVIDDSPFVLESLQDALEPDGIAVDGFDGARGLDGVDLILLDAQLSAKLDHEIGEVMRRRCRAGAPVVLLSSLPEAELAARAEASGLDGYIHKQRGVDAVIDEVRAWLEGRRTRHGKGR